MTTRKQMRRVPVEDPRITSLALNIGAMLAERAPWEELSVLMPDADVAKLVAAALRRRKYFAKETMALVGDEAPGGPMSLRHYVRAYRRMP